MRYRRFETVGFDLACGLCRARLAGCGNANIEQQKAQQARDRELRDENRKFKSFEPENSELPGCARMKTPQTARTTGEIERLRKDNARIQGEIAEVAKARNERLQAAQQARRGRIADRPAGANPGGLAGITRGRSECPREGDEI